MLLLQLLAPLIFHTPTFNLFMFFYSIYIRVQQTQAQRILTVLLLLGRPT